MQVDALRMRSGSSSSVIQSGSRGTGFRRRNPAARISSESILDLTSAPCLSLLPRGPELHRLRPVACASGRVRHPGAEAVGVAGRGGGGGEVDLEARGPQVSALPDRLDLVAVRI